MNNIVNHYLQDEIDNWRALGMSENYIIEQLTARYNDAMRFLEMMLQEEIGKESGVRYTLYDDPSTHKEQREDVNERYVSH